MEGNFDLIEGDEMLPLFRLNAQTYILNEFNLKKFAYAN
jgi:hypothetical protein